MNKKILFGALVGTFGATAIVGAGLVGGMYPEYVNYTSAKTMFDVQVKYNQIGANVSFADYVKQANESITKMTDEEKEAAKLGQEEAKKLDYATYKAATEVNYKNVITNENDLNTFISAQWNMIRNGDLTKQLNQGGLIAGAVILSLSAVALIPTSIFLAKAIQNKNN